MRIAAAPISWGVCEVPGWGRVLEPATVLAEMAALGIRHTELGPPGYLPVDPAELTAALGRHGLGLVGGFLAVALHEAGAVVEAERSAALLADAGAEVLVLAAATGLDGYDVRPVLSDAQWRGLVATAAEIRDVAEGRGLRTVLHPHVGTHVETGADVERFLADSDLDLCLDTGHLLIGGVDPVALARAHPDRIGHVHLKDVRADLAGRVRAGEVGYADAVGEGMYVPLGDGDVDIAAIVACLEDAGYAGWYVLEQDTALGPGQDRAPAHDVARSLRHLHLISGGRAPAGPSPRRQR